MNILITGANGQLGSELQLLAAHSSHTFFFTDVAELDITHRADVLSYFKKHQIEACINCAAYTAVDKAEEARELCDLINVTGAENLAAGCAQQDGVMFHVSTDFVFDGTSSKPLFEDQTTHPVNYYGLSKLKGEEAILKMHPKTFILRTSWLYSTFGNNFVKTMIRLSESKPTLNIISDQIGTPTYARDLAEVILHIIDQSSDAYGIYHYSNEGVASWYDFTCAIFEYEKIDTQVFPIDTEQYPTPAKRPHYSVMNKAKIRENLSIQIPHWRASLQKCLLAMKKA